LANLRRNSLHLPYFADRSVSNMTDFGSVNQNEDNGEIGNKHVRRPKLDLSFASYGYQSPQQQYRVSPTYSDGSDPLISHLMMGGSRSNTPDDSDISNSPEAGSDLIVSIQICINVYLLSFNILIINKFIYYFRIKLISTHMVHLL